MTRTLPDPGTPPTAAELAAYRALAELAARWRRRAAVEQFPARTYARLRACR